MSQIFEQFWNIHRNTEFWHETLDGVVQQVKKVRSHQTQIKRKKNCAIRRWIGHRLDAWTFWVHSLHLRVKFTLFTREIRFIHVWNWLHNRREYASWEGLLPGSSRLVAKCIPVFVKVRRCICSFILHWPPLVMTSLLEQAPDWLMRREYPPKFRFLNSRE